MTTEELEGYVKRMIEGLDIRHAPQGQPVSLREQRRYEIAKEVFLRFSDGQPQSATLAGSWATYAVVYADALLARLEQE